MPHSPNRPSPNASCWAYIHSPFQCREIPGACRAQHQPTALRVWSPRRIPSLNRAGSMGRQESAMTLDRPRSARTERALQHGQTLNSHGSSLNPSILRPSSTRCHQAVVPSRRRPAHATDRAPSARIANRLYRHPCPSVSTTCLAPTLAIGFCRPTARHAPGIHTTPGASASRGCSANAAERHAISILVPSVSCGLRFTRSPVRDNHTELRQLPDPHRPHLGRAVSKRVTPRRPATVLRMKPALPSEATLVMRFIRIVDNSAQRASGFPNRALLWFAFHARNLAPIHHPRQQKS